MFGVMLVFNVCECLSVPEQAGAAHSGPTNTYSSLSSSLSLFVSDTSSFFPTDWWFFSPSLLLFQVSAATIVPNRLEISEWRERQDETGPPRPLLSPSSSVQWTDRHCRWFSPLPPPPPDLGAPAAALPWDSSDSASSERKGLIEMVQNMKNNFQLLAFCDKAQTFKIGF